MYLPALFTRKVRSSDMAVATSTLAPIPQFLNITLQLKKKDPELEQGKYKMSLETLVLIESAIK